jgi:putative ABC transport system permease protein
MLRDMTRLVGQNDAQNQMMYYYFFDADFIDLYDMELAAGRGFAKGGSTDGSTKCLINEKTVSAFGWNDPQNAIGKRVLVRRGVEKEIIGVVKDFHFRGVKYPIEPLIIENYSGWFEHLTLSLNTVDIGETMDYIEGTWKKRFPDNPLEYCFLDSVFANLYRAEERARRLVTLFTGLGLFIACLGLFGLASYSAEQRTKEIGIRKILGASTLSITGLFTQQYIKWIALANIIAWPTAYVVISRWLQSFAYRTSPQIWMFILATGFSFFIAILTIGYKSIKASSANPADALKYE